MFRPTQFLFAFKCATGLPCGCGAKYRVYAEKCNDRNTWIAPEDIDWASPAGLYSGVSICEYPIYAPPGFFPMRASEDTITMALAGVKPAAETVTLYPNPTKSGEVTVEAVENILVVEIYDIANRLVRTESGTVARKFLIE